MGNNISITRTYIHDAEEDGDGNHPDAMQGNAGRSHPSGLQPILEYPDRQQHDHPADGPALTLPSQMQGITQFDADYTNVTITNNIVITRACYGLEGGSDHNALIANNTVLDDGDTSIPKAGCGPTLQFGGTSHQGPASTNVRVSNNLADHYFIINYTAGSTTFDHNITLNYYEPFAQ